MGMRVVGGFFTSPPLRPPQSLVFGVLLAVSVRLSLLEVLILPVCKRGMHEAGSQWENQVGVFELLVITYYWQVAGVSSFVR